MFQIYKKYTNLAGKQNEQKFLVALEGVSLEDERHGAGISMELSKVQ